MVLRWVIVIVSCFARTQSPKLRQAWQWFWQFWQWLHEKRGWSRKLLKRRQKQPEGGEKDGFSCGNCISNKMRQFFTIFPKVDFFTGWWMRTIIVLTFSPSGENVNTNMALIHRQVKGETYHSTLRMIRDQMILWQMILKSIFPLRSFITNNDRRELCFPSPCGER